MSDWIDNVPAGWSELPLKRWVDQRITDGPHETPVLVDEGVPFVSAEAIQDGRIVFEKQRGFISAEAHRVYCRKCKPMRGDILLCKSGATTGKLGMVETDDEFSIWSPLALIRAHWQKADPRFLFYALQSSYIQNQIQRRWSVGTQPNIGMGVIETLSVVGPSKREQREIGDFLNRETARIDSLIAKNRRFLELIEERSTSEVVSVLTGQTRSPSKVSGTEWIGNVPATWEVLPIARTTHLAETGPFGSQLHAGDYEPGGVPVINPVHLREGKIEPDENSAVSTETAARLRRHQLAEGDLVLARRGEVGRCAIVSSREVGWLCGTGSMKLRLKPGHDPQYLNLLMATPGPQEQLLLHSVGSTMPNINPTIMSRLVVPVPPQNDRTAIVNEVTEIRRTAQKLKEKIDSAIEYLVEYRSALISAAVTGQIDVRNYRPQEAAALCQ